MPDKSDVQKTKHTTKSAQIAIDLSQVDHEQSNEIELAGDNNPPQIEYFSTRTEFKNRLSALMSLASKSRTNLIHGTITVKEEFFDEAI